LTLISGQNLTHSGAVLQTDLHPNVVSNIDMGQSFEELLRRFNDLSPAGEQYTPRDAIQLMVNILLDPDDEVLSRPGVVRSIYDPAAGTGGMLSVAEEHITSMNPRARLSLYGQELEDETYAIAKAPTGRRRGSIRISGITRTA
jgi:type I restriction enzyme M protein